MEPKENTVVAPADGKVVFVFPSKHAIGFLTDDGISMLLHIGIDTVKLDGKGFTCFVENGQKVKKGDKLLELSILKGKSTIAGFADYLHRVRG